MKSKNGAADLEVNQGDGGISRDKWTGVIIGALLSKKMEATVEVY